MDFDLNQMRKDYPSMKDAGDDDIIEFVYKEFGADKTGSLDDFKEFIGHSKKNEKPRGDTRSIVDRSVGPILKGLAGTGMAAADLVGGVPGMFAAIPKSVEALLSPITGKPIQKSLEDAQSFAHWATPTVALGLEDTAKNNPVYQGLFGKPMETLDKVIKGTANVASDVVGGDDAVKAGIELSIMAAMAAAGGKGSIQGGKAKGAARAAEITGKGQRDALGGEMSINEALNAIARGKERETAQKQAQQMAQDLAKKEESSLYGSAPEAPGTVYRQPQPQVKPGVMDNFRDGRPEVDPVLKAVQDALETTREGLDLNARRQDSVAGMSPVEAMQAKFKELTEQTRKTQEARAIGEEAIADRGFDNSIAGAKGALDQIRQRHEAEQAARRQTTDPVMERVAAEEAARKEQELSVMQRQAALARGEEHLKTGEASDAIQRAAERAPAEIPRESTGFGDLLKERQETNAKLEEISSKLEELNQQSKDVRILRDGLQRTNPERLRDISQLSKRAREINSQIQTLKRQEKELTRKPISSSSKMGRQRGAINLFGENESVKASADAEAFKVFEQELPEILKGRAKDLWQATKNTTNETTTNEQVHADGPQLKAISKVPGLKRLEEIYAPSIIPAADIISQIKVGPDISRNKLTAGLKYIYEAGGQIAAYGSENAGKRWAAAHIQEAVRNADRDKTAFAQPVIKELSHLKSAEFTSLFKTILDNEGTTLIPAELKTKGFSNTAIKAYNAWQELSKNALATANAIRGEQGKPLIKGIEGHFPHLFYGDWRAFIKNADGQILHVINGKTAKEVHSILEVVKEKTGLTDITITPVEHVSLKNQGKKTSDHLNGMAELLTYFDKESPEGAAIRTVMDDYLAKRGYQKGGIFQHFKGRSRVENVSIEGEAIKGVEGFIGKRIDRTDKQNARDGINAAIRYYERVFEWAHMQEAMKEIGKVVSDPELKASHPNTLSDMKTYLDNYTGARIAREEVIGKLLHDPNLKNIGASVSDVMRGIILGNNPAFFFSQVLQTLTMLPKEYSTIAKQGGDTSAVFKGLASASADMGWAFGGKARTAVGKEAARAAEEYGIVASHMRDEISPALSSGMKRVYHKGMNWAMEVPDTFSRKVAFMTLYHALHEAGLRGDTLRTAAANATDTTMVNYRPQERAQAFQDLGAAGQALGALRTFMNNQLTNTYATAKINGVASVPFLTQITSQLALGGLLGFYAFDELKKVWSLAQGIYDSFFDKRLPSLEEIILSSDISDYITFGIPSAATGLDLSSKFSAANIIPDSPSDAVPYFGALGQIGPNALELLKHPNKANSALLLRSIPNAQTMAIGERMMTENGMLLKKDLSGGDVERTDADQWIRHLGTRTLKESKEQRFNRFMKENKKWGDEGKKTARSNDRKERLEGNLDYREVERYLNHGGTIQGFIQQTIKNEQDKLLTEEQRGLMQQFRNPVLIQNAPERRR